LPIKIERMAFHECDCLYHNICYSKKTPVEVHDMMGLWEAIQHPSIEKQHDRLLYPNTKVNG
jgi:hypothetical protein